MRALNALLVLVATIVVILLVVRLPPPSPELTEAEIAQVEAEVGAYLVELERAYEALDLDWAMSLLVQTPEYVWATRGGFIRGFDAIQEYDRAFMSSLETLNWTSTDQDISVLSQDAVGVLDTGMWVMTDSEGVTTESNYTFTFVLVRREGKWKMLLGQLSRMAS